MIRWTRIVVVSLLSLCSALSGQEAHQDTFLIAEPVGEEAFWALAQFLDYDKGQPLDARIVEKKAKDGFTREKIVFTDARKERVPAYLALPTSGTGPWPVVLLLHGLDETKDDWWDHPLLGLVAKELSLRDFAIVALDAQNCGERRWHNNFEAPGDILASGRHLEFRDMVIQTAVDYRLAMDYLAARAEVDTSRIGMIGYSMGSSMTFMLTAVDPRIKAAVSCVPVPFGLTIARKFFAKDATASQFRDAVAKYPQFRAGVMNVQNYAPVILQPFLVLSGINDTWCHPDETRQLFSLIASQDKELRFFDSGHTLPLEFAEEAVEWIEENLK